MSYEAARALLNKSVSRPTLYSVRLSNRVSRQTNDYINFFCSETSIPEVRHTSILANGQEYMGIVREQPTNVVFGKPFGMTIIENSEFQTYKDLRSWFNTTAQGSNQSNGFNRTQRMNYQSTYTSDIEIIKLEQPDNLGGVLGSQDPNANYKEVLKVTLLNAFPTNIGSVSLSSSSYDSATTFQASFSYESYTIREMNDIIGQIGGFIGGLF
tara:strand:- start:47 stop:682 length:636 start_codon:yes stop_codon:yes gene_type:complete